MSGAVELAGERVRLRPLHRDELELLWAMREHEPSGAHGNRPDQRARLQRRIEVSGTFADGRLDLGIEAEGVLVGQVEARQPKEGLPRGVFELGIVLFPDAQGHGYGTEAIRLLTGYLFDQLGANRVQGSTALWNTAMRRVFEKVGFSLEGVLRGFMPVEKGTWEDYALYAVTRADWGVTR